MISPQKFGCFSLGFIVFRDITSLEKQVIKSQLNSYFYRKFLIFAVLIGGLIFVYSYFSKNFKIVGKEEIPEEKLSFTSNSETHSKEIIVAEFDPNELTKEQWQKLGFSEKQAETILKYKNIVGGNFTSKAQFKKCYSVSDEKYLELEPFLLLPENNNQNSFKNSNYSASKFIKKELKIPGKFNPDLYTKENWMKMGFSEKQAEAIVKYKNYLGGSFISKEKFRECFIINEENYQKLHPYLLLPQNANTSTKHNNEKSKTILQIFDPNVLDAEGWMRLGFSEKQAQVIVNYKNRNLKGSFKTIEDVQKCFVISEEKFHEMKPFIKIESTFQEPEKKSKNTTETTDFSKIDLNSITYKQLEEFGFDGKAAGSFVGYRKKLGGFVNENQILETYNIDKELMQKLLNISNLKTDEIKKYTLTDAPENWLKDHPYFKYYADKSLFFRLSYPDDKKIFKMMKLKPEAEAKMKLYLK